MPHLVLPSTKYKTSYLKALPKYHTEGRHLEYNLKKARQYFPALIQQIRNQAKGIGLPPGWVPHTEYWLVKGGSYLGAGVIRHRLNRHLLKIGGTIGYDINPSKRNQGYGTLILKLLLKKARLMGLKKVLITCDETNDPSYKIIIANGGKLQNAVEQGAGLPQKLRFWIRL